MECPQCGHELSMFMESEPDAGERRAVGVAMAVATWWFPVGLLVSVLVWILVNVVFRPFEPYPTLMLSVLAATLATVAACQGPLILLTQRRAATRDRAREQETLRVTEHTEADLHDVIARLGRIEAAVVVQEATASR